MALDIIRMDKPKNRDHELSMPSEPAHHLPMMFKQQVSPFVNSETLGIHFRDEQTDHIDQQEPNLSTEKPDTESITIIRIVSMGQNPIKKKKDD